MGRLFATGIVVWTLATGTAGSQSFTVPATPETQLTTGQIDSIVVGLGDLMASTYLDSLRGLEVQRTLRAHAGTDRYRALAKPAALVAQLTQDVQAVIADSHFNILYFPPDAPGFRWVSSGDGPRDAAAEIEDERQRLRTTNFGLRRVEILDGNVGVLDLTRFDAPLELLRGPLASAFDFLQSTDALIIDVRKNPGGNPECVQLAFSYFVDGPAMLATTRYTRSENQREEFRTTTDPGGKKYLGRKVFVLTSAGTASGGEMFAYQMQHHGKATIVGGRTTGGAHSFDTFQIAPATAGRFMVLVPNARIIDEKTKGDWEKTGVTPDVAIGEGEDAQAVAWRLAVESLANDAKTEEARAGYRQLLAKVTYRAQHGAASPQDLEKYVGRYGIRTISLQDGRLRLQRQNGRLVDLEPVGEHTFEADVPMSPKPRVRFEVTGVTVVALVVSTAGGEERSPREK